MSISREIYPDAVSAWGGFYPGHYQPIINHFGTVAIQVDDFGYQGDSRILYDEDGKIGLLIFGWGSCSGCDSLKACESHEDVDELIKSLQPTWFDSKAEALVYFKGHDWEGDFSWDDETQEFVAKAIEYLEG